MQPRADLAPAVIVPDSLTALGLVRSLAPRGVACTVAAWNALGPARYSRHARVVACPPPSTGRAFLDAVLTIGRTFATPPVLFVTDESSMLLVQRGRDELAQHFRVALSPVEQLARWVSKPRLYEASAAAGVATPQTWVLAGTRWPADVSYPIVVKPAQRVIWVGDYTLRSFRHDFGCKALLARDAAHAQAIVTRAHELGYEMMLQRPVPGEVTDLLTAGVFAGRDGSRALFTARKLAQVPRDFGDGSVVEGLPLPELAPPVWRLVEQSGFTGVADIEFKRDAADGQLKLLDANPRPWLWIELATRCGINLPYLLYCEATEQRAEAVPAQLAASVKWCSARALVRTLVESGATNRGAALTGALHAWRGADMDGTFAADDLLWRMFLQPAFWRDALRAARHQLPEM